MTRPRVAARFGAHLILTVVVAACGGGATPAPSGLLPNDGSLPKLGSTPAPSSAVVGPTPVASGPVPAPNGAATTLDALAGRLDRVPGYGCDAPVATSDGMGMTCRGAEAEGGQQFALAVAAGPDGTIRGFMIDVTPGEGRLLDEDLVAVTFGWIIGLHSADATEPGLEWVMDHAADIGATASLPRYVLAVEIGPNASDLSLARRLTVLVRS